MQNLTNYTLKDLIDKTKLIQIRLFYDDTIIYFGKYESIPNWMKEGVVKNCIDYDLYLEVTI